MMQDDYVYLEDQLSGLQRLYSKPLYIISANSPSEVAGALEQLQRASGNGYYLAGYFAYELGYALEPCLQALMPQRRSGPLLQFGVFKEFTRKPLIATGSSTISQFHPLWSRKQYLQRFGKIMAYIKAGDVYQINLTFPIKGQYTGSCAALYQQLKMRQPVRYGGAVKLGSQEIVSLSPELFFETKNDHIHLRPMKGTAPRGATPKGDKKRAIALQEDSKNRAENLMIVDLLRNDVARISYAGSVKVSDLFSIETYPSLHTMTSGISAKLKNGLSLEQKLTALFPCGSVTGAPKIRAMEIISELERKAREQYCGGIGLIDPNGDIRLNVGIRTLSLSKGGTFSYPVGSGIVADSDGNAEYDECLLKSEFLHSDYKLIETIGWDMATGFMHLDLHMNRLARSANTLGFKMNTEVVTRALRQHTVHLSGPHKVRAKLAKNGQIDVNSAKLKLSPPKEQHKVALSKVPLDSRDHLLGHKTTRRELFESEFLRLSAQTQCREVLFFNEDGHLCEGSYTNVFVVIGGKMFTPPASCGLLPGVFRHIMLANQEAQERVLTLEDLIAADEIYIGNSVRGLMHARLLSPQRL